MRLAILTVQLPRMPLPNLEDIGAVMKAVPNPYGHTFESYVPLFDDNEPDPEARR